jgi:predicted DNA-binding ribbon-helix-helix protein
MESENKTIFDKLYQQLSQWFKDVEQHEITSVVSIVEQAKQFLRAAEELSEQQIEQFVTHFKQELTEFLQHTEQESQHSIYLGLLEEQFWSALSEITDRTQVEWSELPDELAHQGIYQTGDLIGFGVLRCCQCGETITFTHLSQVRVCAHCGHQQFERQPLEP